MHSSKLRVALVSPLFESVPPKLYGGTERIVSYLAEDLVKLGHSVTLFASGDSKTSAELLSVCPRSLRLDTSCKEAMAPHTLMLEKVAQQSAEFDLIHFNIDFLHFPLVRRIFTPTVTTIHNRLDLPEIRSLLREFNEIPLVAISQAHRSGMPEANWAGTIYHGLPEDLYHFNPNPGNYLAFVGRTSPEKGLPSAIRIARALGMKLKVAAKISDVPSDVTFFNSEIKPLLNDPLLEFVGEIGDQEKGDFLGNARALLFPIRWPEPFGLVMIEAMACGTPVVAFENGSVPEVIEDGISGFIVKDEAGAVDAIQRRLPRLSREGCRETFEVRFAARRMTLDYVKLYHRQIEYHARPRFRRVAQ